MKKLFALTVILTVMLSGCDMSDEDSDEDSDVTGNWYGNYGVDNKGEITMTISGNRYGYYRDCTWVLTFKSSTGTLSSSNGTWIRSGDVLSLYGDHSGSASLSAGKLILNLGSVTYELSRKKSTLVPEATIDAMLKIRNESSKTISNVLWNNVVFTEGIIISGTNATKGVEAGSGFIFFRINSTAYRTRDVIKVDKNDNKEFIFTDYTVIVNILNDSITTIGGL